MATYRFEETIDHPAVTGTLFFPRRIAASSVPAFPDGKTFEIPAGDDTLGAMGRFPHPEGLTVLFFHGNGEVMTDYFLFDFHERIASLGANFLVVDYRGYGLSTGSPSLSNLLQDARAAWAHATEAMGLPPGKIVIMGRSLGSLAALEAASGPGRDALGLVLESGIARFDDWVGRMRPLIEAAGIDMARLEGALRDAFDQEAKMGAFPGPALVMHAPDDEIVPVEHGRLLASWGDPSRTRSRIFPRGGHNDIHLVNEKDYFETLGEFLSGLSPV